jgi:hypothetical protein
LPNAANLLAHVLAVGIASSAPPLMIFWRGLKGRSPHEHTKAKALIALLTFFSFNVD